jgi:hypothetical protein
VPLTALATLSQLSALCARFMDPASPSDTVISLLPGLGPYHIAAASEDHQFLSRSSTSCWVGPCFFAREGVVREGQLACTGGPEIDLGGGVDAFAVTGIVAALLAFLAVGSLPTCGEAHTTLMGSRPPNWADRTGSRATARR